MNPLNHPGITFEMAEQVFNDPQTVVGKNYFLNGEQRFQAIGMTDGLVLLLVVFVDKSTEDEEVIHLISARKASRYKEKFYAD